MAGNGTEDRSVPRHSHAIVSDAIAEANTRAAMTLVEALARLGLRHAVLSPGSRSTPLAIALAKNDTIETHIHFDERGAAFMAYGIGKATRMPAAAVCTSGTAVANYLPAAVEASNAGVPLLLITADRPPELQDCGANQTIHQPGIFGVYARWEKTLPCPDDSGSITDILDAATEAMRHALTPPAGPVHLNCQYREPLAMPTDAPVALPPELDHWNPKLEIEYPKLSKEELEATMWELFETKRGLIVVGTLDSLEEAVAVHELAYKWSWPVFPDISSGLRVFNPNVTPVLDTRPHYDLSLTSEKFRSVAQPDTILHIGGPIVSKRLQQHIESLKPPRHIHVSPDPRLRDPSHTVTRRCTASIATFVKSLKGFQMLNIDEEWREKLDPYRTKIETALESADEESDNRIESEWQLFRNLQPLVQPA